MRMLSSSGLLVNTAENSSFPSSSRSSFMVSGIILVVTEESNSSEILDTPS